jgi:hypothetical protein
MPAADESYRYCEAGLSQQVCAISSETNSCLSCWNVDGAYFNLSYTIVMEQGCQKSKIYGKVQTWSYLVHRGEGKPQSCCNFWSWWKKCSTVAETQHSDQRVLDVMKAIQWTQERMISWNWWCTLNIFSRETQDRTVRGLWFISQGGDKEGQIFEHSSKSF